MGILDDKIIDFGSHKGIYYSELASDYLFWIINSHKRDNVRYKRAWLELVSRNELDDITITLDTLPKHLFEALIEKINLEHNRRSSENGDYSPKMNVSMPTI